MMNEIPNRHTQSPHPITTPNRQPQSPTPIANPNRQPPQVTPDETGGAQSIDIGAMPTSDRIVASSSSSAEIASSAAVGLGVGLGTSLGVGTAMWLYRRRAERAQVGVAGVSLGRSSTGFSK